MPSQVSSVLDIGCGDGYLLARVEGEKRVGIDPSLKGESFADGVHLLPATFPSSMGKAVELGPYNVIYSLAVFEHLTESDFLLARSMLPRLLSPGGRLIISVPHPFVDHILDVLLFMRLIDGQAVEEHHGFDARRIVELASEQLKLIKKTVFQLGLNNLYVFEKR